MSQRSLHMLVVNALHHTREAAMGIAHAMNVSGDIREREDAYYIITRTARDFTPGTMKSKHLQKGVYGIYGMPR